MGTVKKTRKLVQIALLAAIEILLALTPLGFIPLGVTRATTVHIPVILGGILLGPAAGAVLGTVFGLTSILINTFSPTITSFVFTPFYFGGNFYSLIISMVPRILIGVVAYYVFELVAKFDKKKFFAFILSGLAGSMTNTVLVMSGIYVFFGEAYAGAKEIPLDNLMGVIAGLIAVNGVLEAAVAATLTLALGKALYGFIKNK